MMTQTIKVRRTSIRKSPSKTSSNVFANRQFEIKRYRNEDQMSIESNSILSEAEENEGAEVNDTVKKQNVRIVVNDLSKNSAP
jgi:hypothetical protein